MSDIIDIPVADLLFDEENPRLASPNQGQRETLRSLATNQGTKLRVLAEDILIHGLDPTELMMVIGKRHISFLLPLGIILRPIQRSISLSIWTTE